MRESKKNPAACTDWELVFSNSSEAQRHTRGSKPWLYKISKHSTLESLVNRKYKLSTSSIPASGSCKGDTQML